MGHVGVLHIHGRKIWVPEIFGRHVAAAHTAARTQQHRQEVTHPAKFRAFSASSQFTVDNFEV